MTIARSLRAHLRPVLAAAILAGVLIGVVAVWGNAFGAGDKFASLARRIELIIDPPPDRPIEAIVHVTPMPSLDPTPAPTVTASPDSSIAIPTPSPTVVPRINVDVNLLADPEAYFITEIDNEWCAVSGVQIVLAIHDKVALTKAVQKEIASRIGEWESRRDSLNGGWGPAAIAAALDAYGVPGYQVRAYDTRADALRDAAKAISELHAPVMLLAWKGAHTWVMTGYRANADPTIFDDAKVTGAYILDPWYPRISKIWGPSDPPGTFQDAAEMNRNYLPWKRPEGHYPDRDGLYIAVVPTIPLDR